MQSNDLYHQHLVQLAASVKAWSGFVADVARVEIDDEAGVWRFAMVPSAAKACPIEIICHERLQNYDLTIGGETYEGWHPATVDAVFDVLKAVAEGAVVKRQYSSHATGVVLGTTTEIAANGQGLIFRAAKDGHDAESDAGSVCRTMHYLPYRRVGRLG